MLIETISLLIVKIDCSSEHLLCSSEKDIAHSNISSAHRSFCLLIGVFVCSSEKLTAHRSFCSLIVKSAIRSYVLINTRAYKTVSPFFNFAM